MHNYSFKRLPHSLTNESAVHFWLVHEVGSALVLMDVPK